MSYDTDQERWTAIHDGVVAKLAPQRRADLAEYSGDALARQLVHEALMEHYDDNIDRNYAVDAVEQIVRRAIKRALGNSAGS